jgi:hypothetical protein
LLPALLHEEILELPDGRSFAESPELGSSPGKEPLRFMRRPLVETNPDDMIANGLQAGLVSALITMLQRCCKGIGGQWNLIELVFAERYPEKRSQVRNKSFTPPC